MIEVARWLRDAYRRLAVRPARGHRAAARKHRATMPSVRARPRVAGFRATGGARGASPGGVPFGRQIEQLAQPPVERGDSRLGRACGRRWGELGPRTAEVPGLRLNASGRIGRHPSQDRVRLRAAPYGVQVSGDAAIRTLTRVLKRDDVTNVDGHGAAVIGENGRQGRAMASTRTAGKRWRSRWWRERGRGEVRIAVPANVGAHYWRARLPQAAWP
jgi:hypothetical protein